MTDSFTIPEGTMLAHYRLLEQMGEGAMGRVYRAEDTGLDRFVAVKVLRDEVARDDAVVERFIREARAAARVSHPNMTHIHYVGSEGGRRFFAMELVPGEDLERRVRRAGPLDLESASDVLVQAARGLGAAHAAGVVHRDVKPSNLILRPDGTVKVTDFGLSKSLDADVHSTKAGQILGTPAFMSPEQCRGRPVDARSDVYSLGLVAWFLLVGEPPFPGPGLGAVIDDQIHAPLPRLSARRPDLPPAVEDVLDRLCAKDPAHRPPDMGAVEALIESMRPHTPDAAPLAVRGTAVLIDLFVVAVLYGAADAARGRLGVSWSQAAGTCVWSAIFLVVLLGSELLWRRSPGKWLLQLAVVRADGNRPRPGPVAARFLLRFPGAPLGLGAAAWASDLSPLALNAPQLLAVAAGVVCYFVARGRTLSDLLTGTGVAYQLPGRARRRRGGP